MSLDLAPRLPRPAATSMPAAHGASALSHPARLQALQKLDLLDTPAEPSFDRLTSLASRLLKAPISLITLVTEDRQFFKSTFGIPAQLGDLRETPLSHSFCQYVVTDDAPLAVENTLINPRFATNGATLELGVAAYLGVPLKTAEGYTVGSICTLDTQPRRWSAEDQANLSDLAALAMSEIALRSEVAQRKLHEGNLELLNGELAHRMKNVFAVVNGLIAMLAREMPEHKPFAKEARERITALATANSYVRPQDSNPQEAANGAAAKSDPKLLELCKALLSAYPADQIEVVGSDTPLPASSSTPVALILHELATNAVKYGALSVPGGKLRLSAQKTPSGTVLKWEETGGPELKGPPERNGFGTSMAGRSAAVLGATLTYTWARTGLVVHLIIPARA